MTSQKPKKRRFYGKEREIHVPTRIRIIKVVFMLAAAVLVGKLAFFQIAQHGTYDALASGQRDLYSELFPERGDVLVKDRDGEEFPIVTNRYLSLVWAEPRRVDDPTRTAKVLYDILDFAELDADNENIEEDEERVSELDKLIAKLSKPNDPYEPIKRKVTDDVADEIRRANLDGIHLLQERFRYYPERNDMSHITGFVSQDDNGSYSGKYGLEGYFEEELAGKQGYLFSERDAKGRWISVGLKHREPAEDGVDLMLTIDRTVQFVACDTLKSAVEEYDADSGSVIVLDPRTGAVRAMCGYPDFNPNEFNKVEDVVVYNNQATFSAYEPGSVFKPLVMAAGIDAGAVTPQTVYFDSGEEKIDEYTIRNSDLKSYERQTMTEVLEKSLNTGMIFVMREMGMEQMAKYIHAFGFGKPTGIRLNSEVSGNIENVDKGYEIFSATSSYGQGITVTPLQLAMAYTALAHGGAMMRPYIVDAIREVDGNIVKTEPEVAQQVISPRTAQMVSAMLVSVVEHGHGGKAGVDGYYVAGKTGTAQVAKESGSGYQKDNTIATFVGYAPVSNPAFVILVRLDHPRTSQWASSTAAPTFGKIANFLLQYYNIVPER